MDVEKKKKANYSNYFKKCVIFTFTASNTVIWLFASSVKICMQCICKHTLYYNSKCLYINCYMMGVLNKH